MDNVGGCHAKNEAESSTASTSDLKDSRVEAAIGLLMLAGNVGGWTEDAGMHAKNEAEAVPESAPSVKRPLRDLKVKRKLTPQMNSVEKKMKPKGLFQSGMFSPAS